MKGKHMFSWLKSFFKSSSRILVSIPVADNFPNMEELDARNKITDALDAQGVGKFIGAGGGFNQMDFEYDVADAEVARRQVAEAIARYLPNREYKVTVE